MEHLLSILWKKLQLLNHCNPAPFVLPTFSLQSNKLQVILWSLTSAAKPRSDTLSMDIFVVFPDFRGRLFHFYLSKIHSVQELLFTCWTWHSSPVLTFVCPGQIPGWPVLCMCSFSMPWLSASFSVTMGSLEHFSSLTSAGSDHWHWNQGRFWTFQQLQESCPFYMYLTVLSSVLNLCLATSCHLPTSAVVGLLFLTFVVWMCSPAQSEHTVYVLHRKLSCLKEPGCLLTYSTPRAVMAAFWQC